MKWFIHNFFGHPAMAVLHSIGLINIGNLVHDWTLPKVDQKEISKESEL